MHLPVKKPNAEAVDAITDALESVNSMDPGDLMEKMPGDITEREYKYALAHLMDRGEVDFTNQMNLRYE